MPSSKIDNGYSLNLADGRKWQLLFTPDAADWGTRLVSALGLKQQQANGHARLFFTRRPPPENFDGRPLHPFTFCDAENLPKRGWIAHDLISVQFWRHRELPDIICRIGPGTDDVLDVIRMWLSLYPVYESAQDSGGLPFHAALIKWKDAGVLLSGPGGTGKSTCCRRLPLTWQTLCDDETLIVCDRQKRYLAHPFPSWSDYIYRRSTRTCNVQEYLAVSAIFFLEQAKVDEAMPIGQGQAAVRITNAAKQVSCRYWKNLSPPEERQSKIKLFENACELAAAVPAYILRISRTGRFWEHMEKALQDV